MLDAIVAAGAYWSQWVTGTSNGGLTARPGGDRQRWESRIFQGRYDDADPADRPIYGAWNRRDDPYGAAPRFGSAYLKLRPEVLARASFCWPDSVYHPEAVGGHGRLDELCLLADRGILDRHGCPVLVHPGYRATADAIDPEYRGPVPVELARRLGGEITPARLAAASRSNTHDPQAVKWLWHCLARYGRQGCSLA